MRRSTSLSKQMSEDDFMVVEHALLDLGIITTCNFFVQPMDSFCFVKAWRGRLDSILGNFLIVDIESK